MKKFFSGTILAGLFFIGVQFCSTFVCAQVPPAVVPPADDPTTNPLSMADSVRGVLGNIMTLFYEGDKPEIAALINVTQDEADALIDGDESYTVDEGTGESSNKALNLESYDYINEKILTSSTKTAYSPLNSKISSSSDMVQVVKDMFFIENEADNTEARQVEVAKARAAYLKAISRDYIRKAYDVQQKLINDMSAISADVDGNGSIGAVAGLDQTWKAVNKALIADIAMQIELMELDAAKFLSVQPYVVMSKEKPTTSSTSSTEGGDNS